MNKRKAMTIAEVVVSMILLSLVITTSIWLVLAMAKGQKKSYYEYDLQNSVRLATMNLNNVINESSAIFTIQQGGLKFDGMGNPQNLSKEWDYYFVSELGDKILRYVYQDSGVGAGGHRSEVVVPAQPGIRYKLKFEQPKDSSGNIINNKFIGYKLEVFRVDSEDESESAWQALDSYTIETQLEAKSASQVVFRGTDFKPNVALAVRSLKGPIKNQKSVAYVTFILDVSGSMDITLDGKSTSNNDLKRSGIMKKAAKFIVQEYAKEDNVEVILIPFSSTANYPEPSLYLGTIHKGDNHPIYTKHPKAVTDKRYDVTPIKQFSDAQADIDAIKIVGGTNVGDALRRAQHSIEFINRSYSPKYYPGLKVNHYLILLVDGVPTAYTWLSKVGTPGQTKFYEDSGNYYSLIKYKNGLVGPIIQPDGYARHSPIWAGAQPYGGGYSVKFPGYESTLDLKKNISALVIQHYGKKVAPLVQKTFVIGFSARKKDLEGVDFIAEACGIPKTSFAKQVIKFTDTSTPDLTEVFLIIKKQIMEDLWLIRGPQL